MKIVGFITEYNPFHYGHKYHLEASLSRTDSTHSLAIMSGSFVQRGEPSIVDKWTKAKMAINNGVDLVIELPFIYSTQSAELFAFGAVNLMNSLNVVDFISFGSEIKELHPLENIAKVLSQEPKEYKNDLRLYLSQGLSFPRARSLALQRHFKNIQMDNCYDYEDILKQSNNILGIEYLKALQQLNSNILPITIPRLGANYKDEHLNEIYASATSIRKGILHKGIFSIKKFVPTATFESLLEYQDKYKDFNTLNNYKSILNYLLLINHPQDLRNYFDVSGGLENRILQQAELSSNISTLIDNIATKRYPKTRIQRIFIHMLNELSKETIGRLYELEPPYIRVLGSNKKGFEILRKVKENSSVPIINRFSDYVNYNNEIINEFIYYEKKATDIFFLGLNTNPPLFKMDYTISQYNKFN